MLTYEILLNGKPITLESPEHAGGRKVNLWHLKLLATDVKETSEARAYFADLFEFQVGDIFEVTLLDVISEAHVRANEAQRKLLDEEEGKLSCSFCAKGQHEVKKLIAGPGVLICDECTELCYDILQEESKPRDTSPPEI